MYRASLCLRPASRSALRGVQRVLRPRSQTAQKFPLLERYGARLSLCLLGPPLSEIKYPPPLQFRAPTPPQQLTPRTYSSSPRCLSTATVTAAALTPTPTPAPFNSRLVARSQLFPERFPRPLRLSRQPVRHCSYRRHNMCRTQAMGDEASAVNVQSRELLPTNVVPRHYHVTLETNFEKFTFDGTVVIDLDVAEDSKSVSLHTLELDIHSAKITSDGKTVRLVSFFLSPTWYMYSDKAAAPRPPSRTTRPPRSAPLPLTMASPRAPRPSWRSASPAS